MSAIEKILHPKPEASRRGTVLTYTDILFGFVIQEVFVRLAALNHFFTEAIFWHLVIAAVLVLGSWIGYRRSLNRSEYEIKFFNLPFFRFVVDQIMLVIYFRIAVLTSPSGSWGGTSKDLLTEGIVLLIATFVLYLLWDGLGIWMAVAKDKSSKPRYPIVRDGEKQSEPQRPNYRGALISISALAALITAFCAVNLGWLPGTPLGFAAIVGILLIYRFLKEVRTSLYP